MGLLYQLSQQLTGYKPVFQGSGAALSLSSSLQDVPFGLVFDNFGTYASPNYTLPWTGLYRITAVCHYNVVAAASSTCGFTLNLLVAGGTVAASVWQIDSIAGHGYAGPMIITMVAVGVQGNAVKCQVQATNISSGNLGSGSQMLSIEYIAKT